MTVFFAVIISAFLIGYLVKPDTEFSELENRYLTKRPSVTLKGVSDGSFMETFETYTAEQLPFRNAFIRLKAAAERVMLKKENNGIVCGRDGQLFEKLLAYNKNLQRNEDIIASFINDSDRRVFLGIIPNSFEIQKDRLPRGLTMMSEKEAIDGFYERLSESKYCKTVNIYDELDAHRDERIYYFTDHHWTTRGAYYGYLSLCRALDLEPVELESLPEDAVKRAQGFYGTYYAKYKGIGISPDEITWYDTPELSYVNQSGSEPVYHDGLYDINKLSGYDKYAMFMYGNPGIAVAELEKKEHGRELILLKDSYSNCLIPFFTYNYDRITVIDLRYFGGKLSEVLEKSGEADLLLLYNFSHLNEDSNFYKLRS